MPHKNKAEHKTKMMFNTITNVINSKQLSPTHPLKLPAVVKHQMETHQLTTQSKFQPPAPTMDALSPNNILTQKPQEQ